MNKTKVTIDGVDYEVDLAKAKKQGLIKEVRKRITDFNNGDVFSPIGRGADSILVMPTTTLENTSYSAYALRKSAIGSKICNFFPVFPYTGFSGVSKEKILNLLNCENNPFVFNKNILNIFYGV